MNTIFYLSAVYIPTLAGYPDKRHSGVL